MRPRQELSAALAALWQELSTHTGSGFEISPGCWLRDADKEKKSKIEKKYKELDAVGKRRKVCGIIYLSRFSCCRCHSEMPLVCYDYVPFGFRDSIAGLSCHVSLRHGFREINNKRKNCQTAGQRRGSALHTVSLMHFSRVYFFCGQEIESSFLTLDWKCFHDACLRRHSEEFSTGKWAAWDNKSGHWIMFANKWWVFCALGCKWFYFNQLLACSSV